MKKEKMGYDEAIRLTLASISPLDSETVALGDCLDRLLSEDLLSRVDSPSVDASMKDGFALRSAEISRASTENPVSLRVIGEAFAGRPSPIAVVPATAIRILTGASVPEGADAVLAEEFARWEGETVTVFKHAHAGRNILPRGTDVAAGEPVARKGQRVSPGMLGMLAAAGCAELPVTRRPKVAILATGDELVAPGMPLSEGKLYASNLEMLNGWCRRYGMAASFSIVGDRPDRIADLLAAAAATHDAVLTSGGAWSGDRDFVADALAGLGWRRVFHWIRMGPGKAVGFGMLGRKPVFLLPGGPPSNLTAFLQIAFPGLLKLGGHIRPSLPTARVVLPCELSCRDIEWTEFVYGKLQENEKGTVFHPFAEGSRLKSLAGAQAVVAVPEGVKSYPAGSVVPAQMLV